MHHNMYIKALVLYLLAWLTSAQPNPGQSTFVFPITGNVYPKGFYTVTIGVGETSQPYIFDIDTGSDLTWLQCGDPQHHCYPEVVTSHDPICEALRGSAGSSLDPDPCYYNIAYADGGLSYGLLVNATVNLPVIDGPPLIRQLAIGCGYDQEYHEKNHPYVDGILGLGKGVPSILSQLSNAGVTHNVVGHCLSSGEVGGYLILGDPYDHLPVRDLGLVFKSFSTQTGHYDLESADFLFDGQYKMKVSDIVFDSGSTYTYFTSDLYGPLISWLDAYLEEKQVNLVDDSTLSECWNNVGKPFGNIQEAAGYFPPLTLNFTDEGGIVQFQMKPESYLIYSEHGNACLAILHGTEIGLGNVNVIGDISMQDKLVIYDNENHMVGWATADCSSLPHP